jgi:hypothetical protein
MNERDLLTLAGIVEDLIALMRAGRDGGPAVAVRELDLLDDRTLALREKLLADWRSNLVQVRAVEHLQNAVTLGNA